MVISILKTSILRKLLEQKRVARNCSKLLETARRRAVSSSLVQHLLAEKCSSSFLKRLVFKRTVFFPLDESEMRLWMNQWSEIARRERSTGERTFVPKRNETKTKRNERNETKREPGGATYAPPPPGVGGAGALAGPPALSFRFISFVSFHFVRFAGPQRSGKKTLTCTPTSTTLKKKQKI